MRALICLLSGQHIPNLLSVHHFKPDKLVLVESSAMRGRKAADSFRAALSLGGFDCGAEGRCHIEPLEAEDDLEAVRKCLQLTYGLCPGAEWIANLTGGTKPMSIAAYEFFKAVGARLVYVNISKPNVLLGLDGRPPETCTHRPTIREFLAGYGFEFRKKEADVAAAETCARSWLSCARRIATQCPEKPLLLFGDLGDPAVKKRWDAARKEGLEIESGQLHPDDEDLRSALASSFGLESGAAGLRGKLDKYGVEFLTGGWLEAFLWELLDRHAEALGVWDVRLGVRPAKVGVPTDSDFDIAFMRD